MNVLSEKRSVWDQIPDGVAGSNVDLVISDDDCKIMKLSDETGEGIMTMYRVFDGVYIMFNDFHMKSCYSSYQSDATMLAVDHCREGCIEMEVDDRYCCCINQGEMRIDTRVHHKGRVRFPLHHYHGVTIGFQSGIAEQSIKEMMPAFDIDIHKLLKKFCSSGETCVLSADPSIDNLFTQLYHLPKQSRSDYFKVKVVELLVYLNGVNYEESYSEKPYFYKNQVEKIHAMHDMITKDFSVNHTQEELAKRFGINLTTMKRCFKSIYGKPIYQYIKEYRLNRAAEMLLTERNKSVTEIAALCGYDNPGKFGQSFRMQFGSPPLEYRKNNGRNS